MTVRYIPSTPVVLGVQYVGPEANGESCTGKGPREASYIRSTKGVLPEAGNCGLKAANPTSCHEPELQTSALRQRNHRLPYLLQET